MKFRVVIIESERGWGRRIDEVREFDTYEDGHAFCKRYNADLPPRAADGSAPDWYMQAEGPFAIEEQE